VEKERHRLDTRFAAELWHLSPKTYWPPNSSDLSTSQEQEQGSATPTYRT